VFILYFLLTGRRRAAVVSGATMLAATALSGVLAPTASVTYFAKALWNTDRIGAIAYVSNQSLMGLVARLGPGQPSRPLWLAAVAVVLAGWAWSVRRASGDRRAGFAATGVVACLVSPITWIHHLVWLVPALIAFATSPERRLRWAAVVAYVLTGSGIVWLWWRDHSGAVFLVGSNLGVLASLALLYWLPRTADAASPAAPDAPAATSAAAPPGPPSRIKRARAATRR